MRFTSFVQDEKPSFGVLSGSNVIDLNEKIQKRDGSYVADLHDLVEMGSAGLKVASALSRQIPETEYLPLEQLTLLAPLPRPRKNIFCVGRNYHEHVVEGFRARGADVALPEYPQFFTKAVTTAAPPQSVFFHDSALTQALDYEVELAVILGKGGRDISRADAMDHIFGFCIINDITARDLQRRHDQWFKGKSLDGSAPMGPFIVTPDEIGDLGSIELLTRVNGAERQRAQVSQMIFDIPELIAQLSAGTTLEAGDIIATGTPGGVGYAMNPPQFLQSGDVVECSIDRIGTITTRIADASARS